MLPTNGNTEVLPLQVVIPAALAGECVEYCRAAAPLEVYWLAEMSVEPPSTFRVERLVMPAGQENTEGTLRVGPEEMAKFRSEYLLANSGQEDRLFGVMHSHVSGGVSQSCTDVKNVLREFALKPLAVAVTWNVRGDRYAEITFFQPVIWKVVDVPVVTEWAPAEVRDRIRKEVAEKVQRLQPKEPPRWALELEVGAGIRAKAFHGQGSQGNALRVESEDVQTLKEIIAGFAGREAWARYGDVLWVVDAAGLLWRVEGGRGRKVVRQTQTSDIWDLRDALVQLSITEYRDTGPDEPIPAPATLLRPGEEHAR